MAGISRKGDFEDLFRGVGYRMWGCVGGMGGGGAEETSPGVKKQFFSFFSKRCESVCGGWKCYY